MKKTWKVTLHCPREEEEDTKTIKIEANDEESALAKFGRMIDGQTHCVHGPLKVVDIKSV